MKFLLQATSLVAMASMAYADTSSLSTITSAAASSSAAAGVSSSAAAGASSSAAAGVSSSAAAGVSSSAANGASATSGGSGSGSATTSSAGLSATDTTGLPPLQPGQSYAFGPNGQVFVVTPSQAARKRQSVAATLQDCINRCANAGAASCTQVLYTTNTGFCQLGQFTCTPPPAGTTQAVLVGPSRNQVTVPQCLTAPGFAAGLVSLSISASSSASVAASASVSGTVTGTVSVSASSASASSSAVGLAPTCPNDNGKTVTANGIGGAVAFNIVCGLNTRGKVRRSITDGVAKRQLAATNAFGVCITACANTPGCQSLLFNPANGACALFDCVVTVPAGLSGAIRVGASNVCPPTTPINVPVVNNNINLNLNLSVNVNVNINAGTFQGLPYTQVCTSGCSPCPVCVPVAPSSCSICQQQGAPAPLAPQPYWYPPGVPGQASYPASCSTCGYAPAPVGPAPAGPAYPVSPAGGSTPAGSVPAGSNGGKYTGPYSNDAAGVKAAGSLLAGAAALAFALA